MAINLKKKAKKIATNIAEATTTELLKELIIGRIFRQKRKSETKEVVEVPCDVVDRFKFFLNQFGELFQTGYSYNIYSIINSVSSPFKESSEIEKERKQ